MIIYIYIYIIDKGIERQGTGSFVRSSYVSTLCPVVMCPSLRTSEEGAPKIYHFVPFGGVNKFPSIINTFLVVIGYFLY